MAGPDIDDAHPLPEDVDGEQRGAVRRERDAADETLRHRLRSIRSVRRHRHRAPEHEVRAPRQDLDRRSWKAAVLARQQLAGLPAELMHGAVAGTRYENALAVGMYRQPEPGVIERQCIDDALGLDVDGAD